MVYASPLRGSRILSDNRYLSLDVARGIAALCVVVFHWSHFYLATGDIAGAAPDNYPLNWLLGYIYRNGWMGVEFFFILSGAIFFTKYADSIHARRVTGWRFFVLRFSRLYPLHIATLVCVGLLQLALIGAIGHAIIYPVDLQGFVLNVLFAQNWFTSDVSFNAPAWSLSVEVFLYLVFFIVFRYARPHIGVFVAIALFGLWLRTYTGLPMVGRGLWCFFLSGSLIWTFCRAPSRRVKLCIYSGTLAVLMMVIVGVNFHALSATISYILYTSLFSGIVLSLVVSDEKLSKLSKPLSWLGDVSYSSYMLHFPLQLAFMLGTVAMYGAYTTDPFQSSWMMLAFFLVLLASVTRRIPLVRNADTRQNSGY